MQASTRDIWDNGWLLIRNGIKERDVHYLRHGLDELRWWIYWSLKGTH